MIDQANQPVYKGRGDIDYEIQQFNNDNMLASSSENIIPSRNSSLSSIGSKGNCLEKENYQCNLQSYEIMEFKEVNARQNISQQMMQLGNYIPQGMEVENQVQNLIPNNQIKTKRRDKIHKTHKIYENNENNNNINRIRTILSNKPKQQEQKNNLKIDRLQKTNQKTQKINKIQQIGCNCRKSKCLKMYCQCFNLQIFCGPNCNCIGCGNQKPNDQHHKAILDALVRNPNAFTDISSHKEVVFDLGLELKQLKKGCKCKKTKCLKKYCQCYNSGQLCSIFCKCDDCSNHQ